MSDDEADPELLELLRQSLGMGKKQSDEISSDTGEWIEEGCVLHGSDAAEVLGLDEQRLLFTRCYFESIC